MKLYNVTTMLFLSAILLMGTACKSSFVVENVDYTHHLESVLNPDEKGVVTDMRHGLSFNILPFQFQEFGDSSSVEVEEIRLIRDAQGYYFITAKGFNHVYVMEPQAGKLKLKEKIQVTEDGLSSPAFNMRDSVVELVDLDYKQSLALTVNGIKDNWEGRS